MARYLYRSLYSPPYTVPRFIDASSLLTKLSSFQMAVYDHFYFILQWAGESGQDCSARLPSSFAFVFYGIYRRAEPRRYGAAAGCSGYLAHARYGAAWRQGQCGGGYCG